MKKHWKNAAVFFLGLFLLLSCSCSSSSKIVIKPDDTYLLQTKLIEDLYPDKAAYKPNETVKFTLSLKNETGENFDGTIALRCWHLNDNIQTQNILVSLKKDESKTVAASWQPPSNDYMGYMVEALAIKNGKIQDQRNTAVDVSSTWSRFPRYGYLCNYDSISKEDVQKTIDWLCKYHLNGLQFYDWQNSHDQPLAGTVKKPAAQWKDIANRDTYRSTVKNYIEACHSRNMMACNYNLMFAAYDDYQKREIQEQWGLYKDPDHDMQDIHELPSTWASNLNLMNPGNVGWQNYILSKEKEAFQVYGFDVFHVDTLGNRGIRYDYSGNQIDLAENYTAFLNAAKKQLGKDVVMNAVNGYGTKAAANADTDFLYTEVWPDFYPEYSNLKSAIDSNTRFSGGKKSSVIAAYMNYKVSGQAFNENAVKLTDAVIFASGGSHLELGDTGMLSSEYFPNQKMYLSDKLKSNLRSYYDFLVAYENILHAQTKWSELNASMGSYPVSDSGDAGSVWIFGSENKTYDTIQMINLLSRSDEQWRDDTYSCEAPKVVNGANLTLDYSSSKISGVYLASPDIKGGSMFALDYTLKNGKLWIKIPSLKYWDMLIIKK